MGACCSKSDAIDTAAASLPANATAEAVSLPAADLNSYLSACRKDKELQVFDSALCEQTERVLTTFTDGVEVHSLSVDSLRAVTGCVSEVNHQVVLYILNSKKDVWKCQELLDLVKEYFEYSDQVLALFNALDRCLKRAQHRHLNIELALRFFEEESKGGNGVDCSSRSGGFAKTLQELSRFKEEGNPFDEEFVELLQSVQNQQMQLLCNLRAREQKLHRKTKSIKAYKKVSLVIFAACFVGVIIFSVVAAAVSAPPVVAALAAALSAPLGGTGKWLNSLWKKYQDELKSQTGLIDTVQMRTLLTVMELDNIRSLVSKLEAEIEALVGTTEFALRDDSIVVFVIDDLKKKLSGLAEAITKLEGHATDYSRDVRQGRTVVLREIGGRNSHGN